MLLRNQLLPRQLAHHGTPSGVTDRTMSVAMSPSHDKLWRALRPAPEGPGAPNSIRSLLVAIPGAPSSFLFLVVWPGAPSSVLAPSSTARSP